MKGIDILIAKELAPYECPSEKGLKNMKMVKSENSEGGCAYGIGTKSSQEYCKACWNMALMADYECDQRNDEKIYKDIAQAAGFTKLPDGAKAHLEMVYPKHLYAWGSEIREEKRLKKVWVDENGHLCVRLKDNEWYHYYPDGSWG